MSHTDFTIALHEAKEAATEIDVAAIFRHLDPESYRLAQLRAVRAFDRLVDAVLVERERIYAEAGEKASYNGGRKFAHETSD